LELTDFRLELRVILLVELYFIGFSFIGSMNSKYYFTKKASWEKALSSLCSGYTVYAPIKNFDCLDYELIDETKISQIVYNSPKPVTPLKTLFLPVKQNVAKEPEIRKLQLIIGTPSCDLAALDLLDAIYLDPVYPDNIYQKNRADTIIMASACFDFQEYCHCTSYSLNPYPESNCDLTISVIAENVFLLALSTKGNSLISQLKQFCPFEEASETSAEPIRLKHVYIKDELNDKNKNIADAKRSNLMIREAEQWLWKKHSVSCVSCGACATICPTCTCFLLIDRPGFDKVRQLDACQYPGFEKVAAGEDPLKSLNERFRNRYMCKYVWKYERYKLIACTGCGRCIETCIGKINKNTVLKEMGVQMA
jgi:sulfhydrogenase subunit beta (sulfur reductase)